MGVNPNSSDKDRIDAWRAEHSHNLEFLSLSDEDVLALLDKRPPLKIAKESVDDKNDSSFEDGNMDKVKNKWTRSRSGTTAAEAIRIFLSGNKPNFSRIVEVSNFDFNELSARELERIVFLEHMDFNVLPPSTRILSAILVRLDKALGEKSKYVFGGMLNGEDTVLRNLSALQRDVAVGFGGYLEQNGEAGTYRGNSIADDLSDYSEQSGSYFDMDTYAVRVLDVERARLSVPERFDSLLDDLCRAFYGGSQKLFVQTMTLPPSAQISPLLKFFKSSNFLVLINRDF